MLEIRADMEFVLSESIILRQLSELDQYYAFDVTTGDHFSLNATAYWVLERMKESENTATIVEGFAKRFGLKSEDAFQDVSELLRSALENRMIVRRK